MSLFDGYSKAYGLYTVKKTDETGKVQGKAETKRGTLTREMFSAHLDGSGPGIGVIMLRDDDTVVFGAIDYDNKNSNLLKAEKAVRDLGLPLVVCRSKSGGIHFYCFTAEPVPATLMQERLDEWKARLGMAEATETFPKQTARFNANDIGNWINLPYFASDATDRYAVIEGQAIPLAAFLDHAEALRVTAEQLSMSSTEESSDLFAEGPPCLQHISSEGGFVEGTRNDGMMAVLVYLKKRFSDSWTEKVDEYNTALAGLPSTEVQHMIKMNQKKSYTYACKKPPIAPFCQRRTCLKRMYGVGEGDPESRGHDVGGLTRYDSPSGDDPYWAMEIDGKRVMVSNDQFYSRDAMNKAAMAQANVVPFHMPNQRWLKYLSQIIGAADVVELPEDAGPKGQLWEWVENFCLQRVNALEKEEVWLGKPYRDQETQRIYFRAHDLYRYLSANRVSYKEQSVWALLKEHGGDRHFWHLKRRGVNVWSLPLTEGPDLDDEAVETNALTQSEEF